MRILLFVTSIYDTFEDITGDEFKKIIEKLEEIAEIEQDQRILISFCDETENKNIFTYYFRNILEEIKDKNIGLGHQFLGNYYKDIYKSGTLLYVDKFNKEKEIFKYVKWLEDNENFINLYYVDANVNNEVINKLFCEEENVNINIINEQFKGKGIVSSLEHKKMILEKNNAD